MSTALITGASGMLGSVVADHFIYSGWEVTKMTRGSMSNKNNDSATIFIELSDLPSIKECLNGRLFDVCVHCAAITDLQFCESHPDLARKVHVDSTRALTGALQDTRFIYISTDSVFDGFEGNYREVDPCSPVNMYAQTKRLGELEVLSHPNPVVIRTNLYGIREPLQKSLAEWAVGALRRGETISGFENMMFNPLHTSQLAEIVYELATTASPFRGIVHVGSDRTLTKFEFIVLLAEHLGLPKSRVEKARYSNLHSSVRRPLNTSLCTELGEKILTGMPHTIEAGLAQLAGNNQ